MTETKPSPKEMDKRVYSLSRLSRCYSCDSRLEAGQLVKIEQGKDEREVLCKTCAGLAEFRVIPAGDARVTRLAKKYASQVFVIMKWSDLWKCHERQGLLVDSDAVAQVEKELGIKLSGS